MPAQSETTEERGFGPFVTYIVRQRPDGVIARWESRTDRKRLSGAPARGSTWWAPQSRDWWIGVLFAVGSFLFALGTVPAYANAVGARPDAVTFFIGSLFFTSAGFLQYREAVDAAPRRPGAARRKVFVFLPGQIGWQATAVQLVGPSSSTSARSLPSSPPWARRRRGTTSGAPTSSGRSASWSPAPSPGSRCATAGQPGGRDRWPGGSPR
jgi:hypothetical protein